MTPTRPVRCVLDRPKTAPRRPKRRSRAQWKSRVKCELLHTGRPPTSDIPALCRTAPYGESRSKKVLSLPLGPGCASAVVSWSVEDALDDAGVSPPAKLQAEEKRAAGESRPIRRNNSCASWRLTSAA